MAEMQDVIDGVTTREPGETGLELAAHRAAFLDSVLAGLRVERAERLAASPAERALASEATGEENLSAVSPLAYLAALLDYTLTHLRNESGSVDLATLDDTLHQPFGDLPTAGEAVDRELRQVRLVVEVLRRYLDPSGPVWPGIPDEQKEALAADERSYRQAAYAALLFRLGTSYDELLLARGAEAQARQDLADRLGLDPARLDALCLDLATLAEADLEQLFGLADTTRDPLSEGPAIPAFLAWQLERLRERWRREDWPETEPVGAVPLLDPDLVPADHLVPQPPDEAGDDWLQVLWNTRKDALDNWLGELRDAREGQAPPAGLEGMLAAALGRSWADLEAIEADRKEGTDVGPQLR
ncbi:MAG TPA: hypothetical protein VF179_17030, partial [Thermoanaerobaculia bacterium]|nr:hypothetical protein [Thermoanaerobaculia bacterium]